MEQLLFWWTKLFRIKISREKLVFQKRCFYTAPNFSNELTFSMEVYFFRSSTVLGQLLCQTSYFLETADFSKKMYSSAAAAFPG